MTEQQFLTQLEALLLDTQTYADSIPIAYKNYALPIITTDNEQVYKFIVDQNWQDLKSFSEAKLLNLESKMLDMATHQYQINSLTERLFNLKDGFKKHYREPQTKDVWGVVESMQKDYKQRIFLMLINSHYCPVIG
uniref:hypothetical protein n=1 Tax=Flavobacterium sp. TaxID=239 RepID=UPI0040487969